MEFLKLIESIRTPVLDFIMSAITYLGDQIVFIVVALIFLWCINKKWGYRLCFMGFTGSVLNQFLKAIFVVPRPWVIDPEFTIVESARDAATGYSFPSGHTQSVVTVLGGVALWFKRRWVSIVMIVLILLTGFSRMYLGVHTPLDVGVSLITGVLTLFGLNWLFNRTENSRKGKYALGIGMVLLSLVLLLYTLFAPERAGSVAEFDEHGIKNAYTIFGGMLGIALAWWVDDRFIRFEVKAVWWAQVFKIVIGLGLIMAAKEGLKPVFNALFGGGYIFDGIRYFIVALIGGVLWPLTFKWWAKLGGSKASAKSK